MLIFSLYICFLLKHYSSKRKHMRNFWQKFTYAIGNVQVSFQHTFYHCECVLDGFYMQWIGLQFSSTWMRRFSSRKGWTMYCAYCVYWLMKPKHFRSSHHKIMRCWSFSLSHKMLPISMCIKNFKCFCWVFWVHRT